MVALLCLCFSLNFAEIHHFLNSDKSVIVPTATYEEGDYGSGRETTRVNPESPFPWTLPSSDRMLVVRDQTMTQCSFYVAL